MSETLRLEVENLAKQFHFGGGLLGRNKRTVRSVDCVSNACVQG